MEVLDEQGNPISGYTRKDCIIMKKENSTRKLVSWKGKDSFSDLSGKNVRLKFYLANGDLYSFWISPWQSGESRGFLSGGGPGLNPTGIDMPVK